MRATLDVLGYRSLPRPVRTAMDEWLTSDVCPALGVASPAEAWVFEVTLIGEGLVQVGRYQLRDGRPFIANPDHPWDRRYAAQEWITVPVRTAPPKEAFL